MVDHATIDHTGIPGVGGSAELDYVQITSPVTVSATTEATATTVITGSSVAYDGSTVVMIEAWCPYVDQSASGAVVTFVLYDGSSSIGKLGVSAPSAGSLFSGAYFQRRLTPSAASHTYSLRAYNASGTSPVGAGAGGSGNYVPAFIRITRGLTYTPA